MIEKRIERSARREVRASRLDPSQVIYATLGPFPADDPDKAAVWNEGAHTIATYRHRHDIGDEVNPLGRLPRGASARAERTRAQRRLQEAQRRLGQVANLNSERAINR